MLTDSLATAIAYATLCQCLLTKAPDDARRAAADRPAHEALNESAAADRLQVAQESGDRVQECPQTAHSRLRRAEQVSAARWTAAGLYLASAILSALYSTTSVQLA